MARCACLGRTAEKEMGEERGELSIAPVKVFLEKAGAGSGFCATRA